MAGALIAALVLAAGAPGAGFHDFEQLCIANEADPARVGAAARAAGFTQDPARPNRLSANGVTVSTGASGMKAVKDLGDIALLTCSVTFPTFAQADVEGLTRWMGHAAGFKTDLPMGSFVMVEKDGVPHEMAFNRPDKAQTALRTGRLRLVSAEKVGDGLRLMYAMVAADSGGRP